MTDQIVSSAPLTVSSSPLPPDVLNSAGRITVATEFGLNPGGVLTQMARLTVASTLTTINQTYDCWVWDGSQEIGASLFVWDGSGEVHASFDPDFMTVFSGNGTMTQNVTFSLPVPAGYVILLYRNQNATGVWTPEGMTRITPVSDPGLARMTMWYSTSDNPTVTCTSNSALVSWVAVGGFSIPTGGATTHLAANTTPEVDPPQDGGTNRTLVCYATNNWTVWNTIPGTILYADTHAETRPSIAVSMYDVGPPGTAMRDTLNRIENTGAVWW